MDKILSCIDEYIKDLEKEVFKLLEDTSMPLTIKNQNMEPLADQKKVLLETKRKLEEIKNKNYIAECKMYTKGQS
jgi:hypothetical protein